MAAETIQIITPKIVLIDVPVEFTQEKGSKQLNARVHL